MALRAKQPEQIVKRLKCLIFGPAGIGKTTACLQFPKSYVIDCERGTENYPNLIKNSGSAVFQTTDIQEAHAEIKSLLTEKHDYLTLVIDPITGIWGDLLEQSERKVGSEFGRHYNESGKVIRKINNLIHRLDMNVLMTAHQKTEYGPGLVKVGDTFDSWKKYDYFFDVVLQLSKQGEKRMAEVKKQRVEPGSTGLPNEFEFSYENFTKYIGKDVLEGEAKPEILAPADKVTRAKSLVEILKIDEDTLDRWFAKSNSSSLEEMTEKQIDAVIDHCEKLVSKIGTKKGE